MGEVYLAEHTHISRQAAIKLLLPHVSRDPDTVERFFTEARATSMIQHDGIIEIYDCGTFENRAYIIMAYLEGESLGSYLARERSLIGDLGTLAFIGTSVAHALSAAHARGIVHRDLKPDNVYLAKSANAQSPVRIKILDFGIAKLTGADKEVGTSHTRAGVLMGTPLYMAPEQCRGAANVDQRADIYALGCMLYEMATGRPPFVSDNAGDLLIAHATLQPPRASELEPRVPPILDELIAQLLAKDPDARPATMEDVAAALEAAFGNLAPTSAPRPTGTMILPSEPGAAPSGLASASVRLSATVRSRAARPASGSAPATGAPAAGGTAVLQTDAPASGAAPLNKPKPKPQAKPQAEPAVAEAGRPASQGRRGLLVAVAVLLILGGGAGAYLLTRGPRGQGSDSRSGDDPSGGRKPGDTTVAAAPAGMVVLPGRTFTMGSSPAQVEAAMTLCKAASSDCRRDVFEREQPPRSVLVDSFFLDANEVSNADLARWLDQSGATASDGRNVRDGQGRLLVDLHPAHGGVEQQAGRFRARAGREALPAVQVTWWGASAYCAAQGKRLPSEAEWECAARGAKASEEGSLFPWGTRAPTCDGVTFGGGRKGACPALTSPRPAGTSAMDVTGEGIHDLGGNVGEWVRDGFAPSYQPCAEGTCKNPVRESDAAEPRVIRGGDWLQGADACRSAGRSRRAPDKAEINVGFRCAK